VAQKFHFAILRIEVNRASRGLSAKAELLVTETMQVPFSRYRELFAKCRKFFYRACCCGVICAILELAVLIEL